MGEKEPIRRTNQSLAGEPTTSENFVLMVNSFVDLRGATTYPDKLRARRSFRTLAEKILTQAGDEQSNIAETYLTLARDNMYIAQMLYGALFQLNILKASDLQSLLGLKSTSGRERVLKMIQRAIEE